MNKTIVYHVHGDEKFFLQARLSILTLLHHLIKNNRFDYQIAVYTDKIEQIPKHSFIQVIETPKATLNEWAGEFDFVHRIKIKVIEDALIRFKTPTLHVDCDTRWHGLPDEDFAHLLLSDAQRPCFIMHAKESPVSKTSHASFLRFFQRNPDFLASWGLKTEAPWFMYNAGAIGLPQSGVATIRDVLKLSDTLFTKVHGKWLAEQVAFSMIAQSKSTILEMTPVLEHYWPYSRAVPGVIAPFLKGISHLSIEEQAAVCFDINWNVLALTQSSVDNSSWLKKAYVRFKKSIAKRRLDMRVFLSK
jgi:hypothetical protein